MTLRNPFSDRPLSTRLPSLKTALGEMTRQPVTGETQGGSSQRHPGARVAAVDANEYRNWQGYYGSQAD